jgi:hypothetical protein
VLKVATINVCISKMDRELASDMELDSVVFQVSSPDNRLTLATCWIYQLHLCIT